MTWRRIVFLGPPGAGKGTHAKWLAQQYGLQHISTGDMLRAAVRAGTDAGKKAQEFMDGGRLVPDELIIELLFDGMSDEGWILDGFPRTVPQAEALSARLEAAGAALDAVLLFKVPDAELIERLSSRLTCKGCGAIYNRRHAAPAKDGVCDHCGGAVITRADDEASAVQQRLEVYVAQTRPLVQHYEKQDLLVRINANREIETIRGELREMFSAAK